MQLLNPNIAKLNVRNFYIGEKEKVEHLEKIGTTFIAGFNYAMANNNYEVLLLELNKISKEFIGFAYEGAAMALALKDRLTPWKKNRLTEYLKACANKHIYMINVGAGWAYAKLPFNPLKLINNLDPLLKYLAIDGYGFHNGYFKTRQFIHEKKIPKWFTGYELRVFYQGLGRSLWFVDCADVNRIKNTINSFPIELHNDLWNGIGLASSYAGGVSEDELQTLKQFGIKYLSQLAQGAAFAAKARIRAGNLVPHTELACNIYCEASAEESANLTDEALIDLSYNEKIPAYETWRLRIQKEFDNKLVTV